MKDILLTQLKKDPAAMELLSGLKEGRGPAAVFSLPDAARAPVFAALGEEWTALVVLDTEAAAIEAYNEIKAYRPAAVLFSFPQALLPAVHAPRPVPPKPPSPSFPAPPFRLKPRPRRCAYARQRLPRRAQKNSPTREKSLDARPQIA